MKLLNNDHPEAGCAPHLVPRSETRQLAVEVIVGEATEFDCGGYIS